jgi:group I intron endonuclease
MIMGCGIYKITNKIDKKVYIGSSLNISSRHYKHFWLLRKNIHDNNYLQNSFNKFGEYNFVFEIVEFCDKSELIERENYYINHFNSNSLEFGYNLATVNEFRRNTYNNEVKLKLSKHNLHKNSNFSTFFLQNILTNESKTFDNLVDAANYLIENSFTYGSPRNVRQKLSFCLRNKKVNNGKKNNGSIRKTCYKHKFEIIN